MEAREEEEKRKRAGPAIFHFCGISEGETLVPGLEAGRQGAAG